MLIHRRDAKACVEQQNDSVGFGDGRIGLAPHALDQAIGIAFVEPRRIDDAELQATEIRVAVAPVARHARCIVDERQAAADKPVEQCRLAHIGPADNGHGERHDLTVGD